MTDSRVPAGHFSLLYFAAASSYTKKSVDFFPAPVKVQDLSSLLESQYPGIGKKVLDASALTINLEYIDKDAEGDVVIEAGDEVAIIPPVSSG
jgi:molybdopterin converting factor small subunit